MTLSTTLMGIQKYNDATNSTIRAHGKLDLIHLYKAMPMTNKMMEVLTGLISANFNISPKSKAIYWMSHPPEKWQRSPNQMSNNAMKIHGSEKPSITLEEKERLLRKSSNRVKKRDNNKIHSCVELFLIFSESFIIQPNISWGAYQAPV